MSPKFIQKPVDQQVLKTYTTYLTCITSGIPPARIDWSKQSAGGTFEPVSMAEPRFIKMLNGTLVIRNTSDEDRGKYLCTASNGISNIPIAEQVQLTVHGMKHSVFDYITQQFTPFCCNLANYPPVFNGVTTEMGFTSSFVFLHPAPLSRRLMKIKTNRQSWFVHLHFLAPCSG